LAESSSYFTETPKKEKGIDENLSAEIIAELEKSFNVVYEIISKKQIQRH
jgi:hypothetical protein